jgi:hypothetical protein
MYDIKSPLANAIIEESKHGTLNAIKREEQVSSDNVSVGASSKKQKN